MLCRPRSHRRSGRDQWPRAFALDGEREVEQDGVGVVASDDLHADWEPLELLDRDGYRRVADDVRGDRECAVVLRTDLLLADARFSPTSAG